MRARLLLAAAALAAFGASLFSGFHFDDYAIFDDAHTASTSGWGAIFALRQTRPLTYLTFWLNRALGGENPLGYHAVNLALHLAAALLAYQCLLRLMDRRAAWLGAALFAVHPLQAEAVDYIWARAIVLAAVFVFASLLAWLDGCCWLAVGLFALALLAKEECAAFPLALWLLDAGLIAGARREITSSTAGTVISERYFKAVRRFTRWASLGAMLVLSLAAGLRVIYAAAVTPGTQAGTQAGITPWHYLLAEGTVLWRYLQLFTIPYGFTVDPEIRVPAAMLGIAAWLAFAAALAALWRWRRDLAIWLTAAALLLLPSSSIFPAADLAADRRMYLAMLPLSAAAALVLARLRWRAVAPLVIFALVVVSIGRTQVWDSDESLWREAVRRAPDKVRPRIQLSRRVGTAEALELLAEAHRIAPDDPAVAAETGRVLLAAGRPAEALAQFGRALALAPRDANNYNNRGVALQALGQTEAARADFKRALELDPGLAAARENLRKLAP
ncbi:MAG: tetratricopeptide repeat protein [Bryobacteraceae bacterium]|jgi:tetratricopeptide (TPR) repeat protein